jgi:hypothetical protein
MMLHGVTGESRKSTQPFAPLHSSTKSPFYFSKTTVNEANGLVFGLDLVNSDIR